MSLLMILAYGMIGLAIVCAYVVLRQFTQHSGAMLHDGGVFIVIMVFTVLIGAAVIDREANQGKNNQAVTKKIEKAMCGVTKAC